MLNLSQRIYDQNSITLAHLCKFYYVEILVIVVSILESVLVSSRQILAATKCILKIQCSGLQETKEIMSKIAFLYLKIYQIQMMFKWSLNDLILLPFVRSVIRIFCFIDRDTGNWIVKLSPNSVSRICFDRTPLQYPFPISSERNPRAHFWA